MSDPTFSTHDLRSAAVDYHRDHEHKHKWAYGQSMGPGRQDENHARPARPMTRYVRFAALQRWKPYTIPKNKRKKKQWKKTKQNPIDQKARKSIANVMPKQRNPRRAS